MVFSSRTNTKVLTCEYNRLRAKGLVDRDSLNEQERRYADISYADGRGAEDHKFSTSRFTAPYDDKTITYDVKCKDKLKGGDIQ